MVSGVLDGTTGTAVAEFYIGTQMSSRDRGTDRQRQKETDRDRQREISIKNFLFIVSSPLMWQSDKMCCSMMISSLMIRC